MRSVVELEGEYDIMTVTKGKIEGKKPKSGIRNPNEITKSLKQQTREREGKKLLT